ncbi:MAG TPA: serine O-acetyltransferase [Allocoleopsis sp.]
MESISTHHSAFPSSLSNLWHLLQEDWKVHHWEWDRPGLQAVSVHRFGGWCMQPHWWTVPWRWLYWRLYRRIRNLYGIELPHTVKLGRRVVIEHQGPIIIHENSVIGADCILRQGVTLGYRHLDRPLEAPQLGDRVNVGAGAKILGAVTIGSDSSIGANAVVLENVPAGYTAVGIPARMIPPQQSVSHQERKG